MPWGIQREESQMPAVRIQITFLRKPHAQSLQRDELLCML